MFKVNETATGYDLAELIQGESGLFEATSPVGEKFHVVSRAGHSICNLRPLGLEGTKATKVQGYWRIRKIGELRLEQETV
jgi:hypothetical protein